jgi:hypothetical protein
LNAYLINDSGLHQTGDKPGLGFWQKNNRKDWSWEINMD